MSVWAALSLDESGCTHHAHLLLAKLCDALEGLEVSPGNAVSRCYYTATEIDNVSVLEAGQY